MVRDKELLCVRNMDSEKKLSVLLLGTFILITNPETVPITRNKSDRDDVFKRVKTSSGELEACTTDYLKKCLIKL